MVRHNCVAAYRNLLKHRAYTAINLIGLTAGVAVAFLIILYLYSELTYDRHIPEYSRIFRVQQRVRNRSGEPSVSILTGAELGAVLTDAVPEITAYTRLFTYSWREKVLLTSGTAHYYEKNFFLADPSFFTLFPCSFIYGDPETALSRPNGIVITEKTAQRYFGDEYPIGKVLSVANLGKGEFTVTGVVKEMPAETHFHFDILAGLSSGNILFWDGFDKGWGNSFYTYVKLIDAKAAGRLGDTLEEVRNTYLPSQWVLSLSLFPISDIHLYSHTDAEIEPGNSVSTIRLFLLIAAIILFAVCINYINLATARSFYRIRETGIRKTVGATRGQLITQFLTESLLTAGAASGLGLGAAAVLLPVFNGFVHRQLTFGMVPPVFLMAAVVGTVLLIGLISGAYPSAVISSFTPLQAVTTRISGAGTGSRSRNALVVGQFAVSVLFIALTLIMQRQISFIKNGDIGFSRQRIVVVPISDNESRERYPVFKRALLTDEGVASVTASASLPDQIRFPHYVVAGNGGDADVRMDWIGVDFDFLSTYGMELAAGRDFSEQIHSDREAAYIINEAAAARLGWDDPVGKSFHLSNKGLQHASFGNGTVIGVVKNFHFRSFHEPIQPLVIKLQDTYFYVSVKIRAGSGQKTISRIHEAWKKINPTRPFTYYFFDDHYDRLYRTELVTRQVMQYAAGLALIIALLGLFGLAMFKTVQRTKELGIRKILGATSFDLYLMLGADFTRLVMLSFLIAWPASYLIAHRWLNGFYYHITLGAGPFLLSGLITLVIACLTVSFHTIRAGRVSPSQSLRQE